MQLDNRIAFFTLKRMGGPMRELLRRLSLFLQQRKHSVYDFLVKNGFFDEMVRGIVKLVFFIIVLHCFKQVIW